MAVIARDPDAPYTLLSETIRIGKHKGCTFEEIFHDVPDYVDYLVVNNIIEVAGEVEEELLKFRNTRDGDFYNPDDDPFSDLFGDNASYGDDESIADYL